MARPKKENKRKYSYYSMDPGLKDRLDFIHKKHQDRYKRLRGDIVNTSMEIALAIIERFGPEWYYKSKDVLVKHLLTKLR